ncbi:MAG: lysophospholipid acyltransferase family protein [Acidobacteria bacterium]|nr:lysophospholipid acyltransferase family protein [Acidobacteriota bacterium]
MSSSPVAAEPSHQSNSKTRDFSFRERILLWLISWAGYLVITLIGCTLRWSISWEDETLPPNAPFEKPAIYSFWHRSVLAASWIYRNSGLVGMASRSFDGEYIARIIERLGFTAVRGSSSRGGVAALVGMRSEIERGAAVALTIDGPRGPKYVAKLGPVALAKATGRPMMSFYVAVSGAWVLDTWDELVIPKPFSKALVRFSKRTLVPSDADEAAIRDYHAQLQSSLERVTRFAEENVARVGSDEFPIWKK